MTGLIVLLTYGYCKVSRRLSAAVTAVVCILLTVQGMLQYCANVGCFLVSAEKCEMTPCFARHLPRSLSVIIRLIAAIWLLGSQSLCRS
jgi:hypothetical protein